MTIFQALILAIVEGITEFLPISSTGHLVLTSDILRLAQTEFQKSFEIIIQGGAILAVVFLYGKTLLRKLSLTKQLLAAFIPTAIIGFILYKLIKHVLLGNFMVTVVSLFVGGVILILLEKFVLPKRKVTTTLDRLTIPQAIVIGLVQSISVIPGVSRAGATIVGGLLMGLSREEAVEFSFLLAVPTILAASVLDIVKTNLHFTSQELMLLGVGFVGSCIVALITIRFFLKYIKNHSFIPFGIYRIAVAIVSVFFGIT